MANTAFLKKYAEKLKELEAAQQEWADAEYELAQAREIISRALRETMAKAVAEREDKKSPFHGLNPSSRAFQVLVDLELEKQLGELAADHPLHAAYEGVLAMEDRVRRARNQVELVTLAVEGWREVLGKLV